MNRTRVTFVTDDFVTAHECIDLLQDEMGSRIIIDMVDLSHYFNIHLTDLVVSNNRVRERGTNGSSRSVSFILPQRHAQQHGVPFVSFSVLFKAQVEAIQRWNLPFTKQIDPLLAKYKAWRLHRIVSRIKHAVATIEKQHKNTPSLAMA
jgi:hypothetical protein